MTKILKVPTKVMCTWDHACLCHCYG